MWFVVGFLIGILFGGIGALLLILWYTIPKIEKYYVFRPARDVLRTPQDLGIPFDQCFIDTPDGIRLGAWHICPRNPVGSIVYFHGNGGNLGILNEIFAMFYRHELEVFAIDYRGYGWSTGSPSEEGLYVDAVCAVQFFIQNFRKHGVPLIYWGRSLGGTVAAYAAGKIPPDGLVLETAFPSKSSLLEHYPQFRPFQPFSKFQFDTVEHLKDHEFPVLLVHGDKDRTVPLKQGQLLYSRLSGPKEFWRVEGGGHVDIHMRDSQGYMQRILQFVKKVEPVRIN